MCEKHLSGEVVMERDSLNVLLYSARDLALIPPGIWALKVGRYGGEELVDLLLARIISFGYVRWGG